MPLGPQSMAPEDGDPALLETAANAAAMERPQDTPSFEGAADGSLNAPPRSRLLHRRRSVHQFLGGGTIADIILWRKKHVSASILVGTTLAWIFLERSGFSLLTIVSDVLFILIIGLFVWANTAAIFHKAPPGIPELHLSEDMVINFASALRVEINKALGIAHDIALGKDLRVFLKVVAVLWGLSIVGGCCHFLSLIYICVVISHSIPVIYERYQDQINGYTKFATDGAQKHYSTLSDFVARKVSKRAPEVKKLQ